MVTVGGHRSRGAVLDVALVAAGIGVLTIAFAVSWRDGILLYEDEAHARHRVLEHAEAMFDDVEAEFGRDEALGAVARWLESQSSVEWVRRSPTRSRTLTVKLSGLPTEIHMFLGSRYK